MDSGIPNVNSSALHGTSATLVVRAVVILSVGALVNNGAQGIGVRDARISARENRGRLCRRSRGQSGQISAAVLNVAKANLMQDGRNGISGADDGMNKVLVPCNRPRIALLTESSRAYGRGILGELAKYIRQRGHYRYDALKNTAREQPWDKRQRIKRFGDETPVARFTTAANMRA